VTGCPALVDQGDAGGRRELPAAAEQQRDMWAGTRRLVLLQLGSPLRTLDRALSNSTKLALSGSDRMSAAEAYRGIAEAVVDRLLLDAGGPAWEADAFDQLVAQIRSAFAATATRAADQVGQVLRSAATVDGRLASLHHESLDATAVDVDAHLRRLLHTGWIGTAGLDRLPDLARYLKAVEHRVAKAVEDPARDQAKLAPLLRLERDYRSVARADVDGTVRWQLEELRVATFAQPVGPKGGPSEAKLRAAIARLGA
jgi:ATP-dependent helicase HrpA